MTSQYGALTPCIEWVWIETRNYHKNSYKKVTHFQSGENGFGKIIFTASILSYQGGLFVPSYASSKGGIAQLTKALSNELAQKGLNVNAIAPGYISTDITTALRTDPKRSADLMARIPMKRWGTIEDLGGAAVYLASEASNYVNGELLNVDGGWMGR